MKLSAADASIRPGRLLWTNQSGKTDACIRICADANASVVVSATTTVPLHRQGPILGRYGMYELRRA